MSLIRRRDGREAEGARLESVFTRKGNVGSNPTLSAITLLISHNLRDRLTSTSVHSTLWPASPRAHEPHAWIPSSLRRKYLAWSESMRAA